MISFKLFVEAIHHAIVSASDSLMDKNEGLLDKYFEKPVDGEGKNKGALVPKIVQLEYPALDDTGAVTTTTVQVPLITLVPVTASKIEKMGNYKNKRLTPCKDLILKKSSFSVRLSVVSKHLHIPQ